MLRKLTVLGFCAAVVFGLAAQARADVVIASSERSLSNTGTTDLDEFVAEIGERVVG